jgi:hypothetical protein
MNALDVYFEYSTISDPNGRFVFEKVHPGKAAIYKVFSIDNHRKQWVNQTPVDILPDKNRHGEGWLWKRTQGYRTIDLPGCVHD